MLTIGRQKLAPWPGGTLAVDGLKQQNLLIGHPQEPAITVDNIEVAQFIHLLIQNAKFRDVIDTATAKIVLILGRFSTSRKPVLDQMRARLRTLNYLPVLFDFDVPTSRDLTETVSIIARMARFIIADLTDPNSLPKELEAIIPASAVPVQPIIKVSDQTYAMFDDYKKYPWVLPLYFYTDADSLYAALESSVIAPAENMVSSLRHRTSAT